MKNPLVSFCIPTFNRAKFLRKTLESALNQTVNDFEIIIVDDASTDSTEEVVRGVSDKRIRYFRNQKNLGVPKNYNYVFSLARGEFLCLLEDHDLLEPNYLKELLPLFKVHPTLAFAFCAIMMIDQNGNKQIKYSHSLPKIIPGNKALRMFLTRLTCPCSLTTLIRRSSLADLKEPFSLKFWWYADINLWMQLVAKGDLGYVNSPLLQMRIREENHFLKDKEWETLFAVDQIHQENWKLLYPKRSFRGKVDRWIYAGAKTWNIFKFKANKIFLRQMDWSEEDIKNVNKFLPALGVFLVSVIDWFPTKIGIFFSHLYRSIWRLVYKSR